MKKEIGIPAAAVCPVFAIVALIGTWVYILLLEIFLKTPHSQFRLIGNGTCVKTFVACARSIFILGFPERKYPSRKSIAHAPKLLCYVPCSTVQLVDNTNKTALRLYAKNRKMAMRHHFNATPHRTKCETPPNFGKDLHAPEITICTILTIMNQQGQGESWLHFK